MPQSIQDAVRSLQAEVTSLKSQLHTLYSAPAEQSPFRRIFHTASLDPRLAAAALIRYTRHSPPNLLLHVARLCLHAPVGRVGHRRALRAVAVLLLDELLARNPGHTDAMCLKGEALLPYIHYGKNDSRAPRSVLQEAFELFDNASKLGSTLALFLKGRWLLSMEPLHKDAAQARLGSDCVKSAAEANCPRALVFLAHRYEYPELDRTVSFAVDLPKGKAARERFILGFYQRAAKKGDPDALNDIGTSYAEGYGGLECDFDKAVEYYVRAIDRGSLHAFDNLGTHYETGMGNRFPHRVDYDKALYYYRQGARQRCPKCAYNLAAAHEEGMSGALPRNTRKAENYYRHALKLADDANDILTAGKCMKDLSALYITRIKLNHPASEVAVKAQRRLLALVVDQAVIDRVMVKINKAIAAANRSKPAALSKLLGELNSKIITKHVKELDQSIKNNGGRPEDVAMLRHALGSGPVPASQEETVEPVRNARKRARTPARRPASSRKRRRR